MRKLVLTMSISALALIFSAGAFAEDATAPSAPQTIPQAAPAQQGSTLQGAPDATKSAGAQAVKPQTRHARHHHRLMTKESAKAAPSGGEKAVEPSTSAQAPASNKVAMQAAAPTHHHHRSHHRSSLKPATPPSTPGASGMPDASKKPEPSTSVQ